MRRIPGRQAGIMLGGLFFTSCFGARVDTVLPVGAVRALVAGDLNRDGKADLVVGHSAAGGFGSRALLSLGDGSFATRPGPTPDSATVQDLALGDYTGDGKLDLAAALIYADGLGPAQVYRGRGDGTFEAGVNVGVPEKPRQVAFADLNHDGRLDLLIGGSEETSLSTSLWVYLNSGGPFTAPTPYDVGRPIGNLATGDLNGDGRPDVVTAVGVTLKVLLNNGAGALLPAVSYPGGGPVALGDMNRDGKLDVVTLSGGQVRVRLNLGGGALSGPLSAAAGGDPRALAVGDINRDGKPDVLVAHFASNSAGLFLGRGDGGLQPRVDFAVGAGPFDLAVADVTGDHRLDTATLNQGDRSVSALLNTLAP